MPNKKRPSKAAKAAALELIREGVTHIRGYSKQSQRGFSDMPLFATANADRQQSLF